MRRKRSQTRALQYALDAMCSFDQSKLTDEEQEAIDIIADLIARRQQYEKARKLRYEGEKYYKKIMEERYHGSKN